MGIELNAGDTGVSATTDAVLGRELWAGRFRSDALGREFLAGSFGPGALGRELWAGSFGPGALGWDIYGGPMFFLHPPWVSRDIVNDHFESLRPPIQNMYTPPFGPATPRLSVHKSVWRPNHDFYTHRGKNKI